MNMQKAEVVPGLMFRGRRVYLEQKGMNNKEVDDDVQSVKRDCLIFAVAVKKMADHCRTDSGMIITPAQFKGPFVSEYNNN